MALTTKVKVDLSAFLSGTPDLSSSTANLALSYTRDLLDGVTTGKADLAWLDNNTLAASATSDIDLAGSLTSALGSAVVFARVKLIVLVADAGNTNNVVLGGAASAQFVGPFGAAAHTVAAQPGGAILLAAPGATAWPVTATSADLLRVANGGAGTSVSYSIAIVGASA